MDELLSANDLAAYTAGESRTFHSATHEEILLGATADLYFVRSHELLSYAKREHTEVAAEIFCSRPGVVAGVQEAGADAFGVGSFISGSRAIDMTMDLKEIDGKPVAKRGRIPGLVDNPRLVRYR